MLKNTNSLGFLEVIITAVIIPQDDTLITVVYFQLLSDAPIEKRPRGFNTLTIYLSLFLPNNVMIDVTPTYTLTYLFLSLAWLFCLELM